MIRSPRALHATASDLAGRLLTGHAADLRAMPAESLPPESGPARWVRRYLPPEAVVPTGPPVLLVPPPATSSRCFDLRRGHSLAEHLVGAGRRCYVLGGGPVRRADREQGLEFWVGEILASAICQVSSDAGGQPVQVIGWSLGGLVSLLAAAADPGLPIASISVIAAPAVVADLPPAPPPRPLTRLTGGLEACAGGPFAIDPLWPQAARFCHKAENSKYFSLPCAVLKYLDNASFLAQIEAADRIDEAMPVYLGRTAERLYRSLFRANFLNAEAVEIGGRQVRWSRVGVPVLAIAGFDDRLAPPTAVHALLRPLTGSPDVRFSVAPGGHLGVLTGRNTRRTTWARLDRWLDEGAVRHGMRPHRRPVTASV